MMEMGESRGEIVALPPGAAKERDLSWFDWSLMGDMSADGRTVLFSESGEGGGQGYSTFLRATDGSPAVRLGEGSGATLAVPLVQAAAKILAEMATFDAAGVAGKQQPG